MQVFLALVGVAVAVGTPLGTYLGVVKGHAIARANAVDSNATASQSANQGHFRWACEQAWSDNDKAAAGGIAILKSMLLDPKIDHDDLVAIAGVLDAVTASALARIGDSTAAQLAPEGTTGDSGGST